MKKFSPKKLSALLVLGMFIGVALAAPNRQNTFPEKEPTEADYAAFLAEKEKQLALAQTPQEKKLALAVMPDAPRVNIRGTVTMPDGSPIPGLASHFWCSFQSNNFIFSQRVSSDGVKSIDKNSIGLQTHDNRGFVNRENHSLDFSSTVPLGANVLVDVYYGVPNPIYKEILSKPVAFVAHPGMKPLEIRLEKGIPLRGKSLCDNGSPAPNHGFHIEQKFEAPLGADIPEIERTFRTSRWTHTNSSGNYEIFLLPGEYTIRDDHTEQTLIIAETDKEKKLDLTRPTPIWVKIIDQEDQSVDGCQCVVIDDANIRFLFHTPIGWSVVIEPADHNRLLYVIDEEHERGTLETITPDMIGKTMKFRLKPVSSVAVTLVDLEGNPLVDKEVELSIKKRQFSLYSSTIDFARTDSTGKAVLRVAPGSLAVTIKVPGSVVETAEQGNNKKLNEIDKELNLVPGETLDMGIVRLSVK